MSVIDDLAEIAEFAKSWKGSEDLLRQEVKERWGRDIQDFEYDESIDGFRIPMTMDSFTALLTEEDGIDDEP